MAARRPCWCDELPTRLRTATHATRHGGSTTHRRDDPGREARTARLCLVDPARRAARAGRRLLARGRRRARWPTAPGRSPGSRRPPACARPGSPGFHNQIQRWLIENTRLGIPAVIHEEAVAGFCARDAVQFPQAIGLAATFDADLLARIGDHIRAEMLAVGARQALSPGARRRPRPALGARGGDLRRGPGARRSTRHGVRPRPAERRARRACAAGVVATAKHFLGYGVSDGGLNHGPVHIGSRELREVYAEPFAAAIRDAGPRSRS